MQAQLDKRLAGKANTPTPVPSSHTPVTLPGETAEEKRERLATQEISAHQAGIEEILNKYTTSHITVKEASRILMGNQISKWARRLKSNGPQKNDRKNQQLKTQEQVSRNHSKQQAKSSVSLLAGTEDKNKKSREMLHSLIRDEVADELVGDQKKLD